MLFLFVIQSLFLLADLQEDTADGPASADGAVAPPMQLRAEYFVLEEPAGDPHEPVGVVAWRHVVSGANELLERDVFFRADMIQVHHVERLGGPRPGLVFRELAPGGGRTWLAQIDLNRRHVETTSWGEEHAVHEVLPYPAGAALPLSLLELNRESIVLGGAFACLDPLTGRYEHLAVRTLPGAEECAGGGSARTVEWRHKGGSLAGRFLFQDRSLVAFQWQEGGVRARRIDEREYLRFAEDWTRQLDRRVQERDILSLLGR